MRSHAKAPTVGSTEGRATGRKRFARLTIAASTLFAFGLLLLPASALAVAHPFLETFGSANQPSFEGARGMAVDQASGDVLVIADEAPGTVNRFNEDGTPSNFSALASNVLSFPFLGGASETQVAVDSSGEATDGNIYVPLGEEKEVKTYDEDGNFLGGLTESSEGEFEYPCGVAVDEDGNLYVGDLSGKIHKFANPPVNGESIELPFEENCALAAGAGPTDGFIFAAHFFGSVVKLDTTTGDEEYEVDAGPTTTLSVDPASGHLYTARGEEVAEFDASGASEATEVSSTPLAIFSFALGVAVNGSTGNVYVTQASSANIEVFGPIVEEFELTINETGTGSGSVECEVNGGGLEPCPSSIPDGSEVKVVATPDPGSEPAGLSGSGSAALCSVSPCEFTITEDSSVTAEFNLEPGQKSLTINTSSGTGTGTVNCEVNGGPTVDVPCNASYTEGTQLKLIPVAGANSLFTEFKNGSGSASGCSGASCEFTLSEDSSVEAPFNLVKRTLSVTKNGTGTGTVTSAPAGIACGADCTEEYDHGTSVVLTGVPDANNQATVGWSGCDSSTATTCTVAMSEAKGVTATFNLVKRTLSVTKNGTGTGTVTSAPAGIACGADCTEEYDHGTSVVLTGVPDANNQATVGWSGCDSSTATTCTVAMSAAKGVTATFSLVKRQLTVAKNGTGSGTVTSAPAGIACGADCTEEYDHGTSVVLTGVPDANNQATVGWSGCDSSTATTCTVAMSAAKGVTATFNLLKRTLTVTKSGTGTGEVTSAPGGIACGGDCSEQYDHGKEVTLTPVAAVGSEFKEWTGACSGSGSCKVTMSAGKVVGAKFELIPRSLSVNKAGTGSGTITCDGGPCAPIYPHGTSVTLAASPAAGSSFTGWSGAGCSGTANCVVTMNADTTLTATFDANPLPAPALPSPPALQCLVPTLKGLSLAKARSALTAAHCKAGKVSKPKAKKGKKLGPLVVKSSQPGAGAALPENGQVDLKLGPKPKKKGGK